MTRVFSAHVKGGVIVADGLDLPEGTTVTVAANDGDGDHAASPEELSELDAAVAEADADEADGTPHEAVLAELDRLHTSR